MSFDLANTETAVATAVTGLYAAMQYHFMRKQAEPHLSGFLNESKDGTLLLRLFVHPTTVPIWITKLTVSGCDLSQATQTVGSDGRYRFKAAHHPRSPALALDVRVPPDRVSTESATVMAFLAPRSAKSSFRISIHTRFMYLPVRYSIVLKARSARA
ncbi:hypothetical protein PPN31119_03180 [Pandoraea pnomenusa]|uniref:DUF1214 domain-containing protein n=1 Tax=Pandoraea pnomenusa TaxID=93220 RepID=A0ABY6WM28_9BURK|nr:hypothetical protein [Pandoraea pnomenusa]VVE69123.1 hypothetical protein PPN31119_03180 [Pandoraea pnomenusa]